MTLGHTIGSAVALAMAWLVGLSVGIQAIRIAAPTGVPRAADSRRFVEPSLAAHPGRPDHLQAGVLVARDQGTLDEMQANQRCASFVSRDSGKSQCDVMTTPDVGMTLLPERRSRVLWPQMRENRSVLPTATITTPGSVNQTAAEKRDADDAAKLIEVLRIGPGSTVADIGAGSGALEPALSRAIGAEGRLYATDISADQLADIRKVIASDSLSNVTVLQGATTDTNLPAACCDAIFMRLVYHALSDPTAMNASLLRSLKPGGRLAVLAFRPESGVSAAPGKRSEGSSRGVMPATIVEELTAAGFAEVREVPWPTPPTFAVVAQRPGK